MIQYLPILVMIVLAALFAGLSIIASAIMSPRHSNLAKSAPYECGIIPGNRPPERFPVRFYLVAMIFIVFDIEIIFIYPYAVISKSLGVFGVSEMIVFGLTVYIAFLYLVSNGALNWGQFHRNKEGSGDSMERTTSSTVRRINSKGEEAA